MSDNLPPGCTDAMIDALCDDGHCPACGAYRDSESDALRICKECGKVCDCGSCKEMHEGKQACQERQWDQMSDEERQKQQDYENDCEAHAEQAWRARE